MIAIVPIFIIYDWDWGQLQWTFEILASNAGCQHISDKRYIKKTNSIILIRTLSLWVRISLFLKILKFNFFSRSFQVQVHHPSSPIQHLASLCVYTSQWGSCLLQSSLLPACQPRLTTSKAFIHFLQPPSICVITWFVSWRIRLKLDWHYLRMRVRTLFRLQEVFLGQAGPGND